MDRVGSVLDVVVGGGDIIARKAHHLVGLGTSLGPSNGLKSR